MPEVPSNSADATLRQTASQAAQELSRAENVSNLGNNLGLNSAIDTAIAALPAPLPAVVQLLGTAIYTALKIPPTPVIQPAPQQSDPIKAFAFSIAFAIIQVLWCFIKSLLNPLPIIGIFFPLCPPQGDVNNSDNLRLTSAKNRIDQLTQRPTTQFSSQPVPRVTSTELPDLQGISFQQFLRDNNVTNTEERQTDNEEPPPQPENVINNQPDWQPGEQTFDSIRRRFGL